MPAPRFSVVIPTYQRREVVARSVQALAALSDVRFEVLVVVDGSTDGTAAALGTLALPFPLTVMEQPNAGRAAAVNAGAAQARGELLLFLDDDMEADPRLLAEHDRSHRDGVEVVLGHIPLHPESPDNVVSRAVGAWAEHRGRRLAERSQPLPLSELITGQMSIARELFLGIGGFDTRFTRDGAFGNEDLDLGQRLFQAGHMIAFNANAISRQRYVVTPRQYLHQWRDVGGADVLFARKHPDQAEAVGSRPATRRAGLAWRPLRLPLRALVLALTRVGMKGRRVTRLFFVVRDLEYFRGVRAAGGPLRPRPVRVLCYHSVSDLAGRPVLEQYGIPEREFSKQIARLRRHFHLVDSAEFAHFLRGGGLPRRPLLLTFDDCYKDLVGDALPVLLQHRARGFAFAVTGRLGGTNDWDAQIGAPQLRLADAADLRTLAEHGIAVGSHSRTHPMLNRLEGEELRNEIAGSADDLERLGLGRPAFFAYPYGEHDESVRGTTEAAGFEGAFSLGAGLAHPDGDRFAIPRIEILRADSGRRFLWRVVTGGRFRRDVFRRRISGRRARFGTPSPPV
jgi:peptidoglycan/xylan/chitin deacetylase (PgdA/CDA1 family)/glycosyltransferase involved in cell wall biosynthesis